MCYFQEMYLKRSRLTKTAVVSKQDASELTFMINGIMERHGIRAGLTAERRTRFGI